LESWPALALENDEVIRPVRSSDDDMLRRPSDDLPGFVLRVRLAPQRASVVKRNLEHSAVGIHADDLLSDHREDWAD
jgi:hypothetical protein